MPIDVKTVKKIADLAKLSLTSAELEQYSTQLEKIVDYVEQLQKLDTSQVQPLAQVHDTTNVMRPDEVKPSLNPDEVFQNAPARQANYFVVPKVIKGTTA